MHGDTLRFSSPRFEVFGDGNNLRVTCRPAIERDAVLRWRARELRRALRRALRRHLAPPLSIAGDDYSFTIMPASDAPLREAFPRIDRTLAPISSRPLTGHAVEALLAITTRERVRWTKDGRLPTQGMDLVRGGQVIALPTYAPATITALMADQSVIDAWRAAP